MALSARNRAIIIGVFGDRAAGTNFCDKVDAAGTLSDRTKRAVKVVMANPRNAYLLNEIVVPNGANASVNMPGGKSALRVAFAHAPAADETYSELSS